MAGTLVAAIMVLLFGVEQPSSLMVRLNRLESRSLDHNELQLANSSFILDLFPSSTPEEIERWKN